MYERKIKEKIRLLWLYCKTKEKLNQYLKKKINEAIGQDTYRLKKLQMNNLSGF